MIYTDKFGYKTSVKNLESASDIDEEKVLEDVLVGFIHIEPKDEENLPSIETKLVKNLKWAARKNETDKVKLIRRSPSDFWIMPNLVLEMPDM